MGPRATAAAVLACCALAACRDPAPKQKAAPDARPAGVAGPSMTTVTPRVRPAALPEPRLPMPREVRARLLDAGKAPRAVRRYKPVTETRELEATLAITTEVYRDGVAIPPVALPPVREGFGVSIEPTREGATIALRGLAATVADAAPDARPGAPADAATGRAEAETYLARWRALVERRRVSVPVDDRGRPGAIALTDDPSATRPDADATRDEWVQRWLGVAVPLPAEPVGVGARWEVVTLLRTGGAVLKQTATYELTAATRDAWTIALTLERLGEHQRIDVPGLPPGASAELMGLRRTVTGTLTLSPASPLPRAGALTSVSSAHARYTGAGGVAVEEASDDRATITLTSK